MVYSVDNMLSFHIISRRMVHLVFLAILILASKGVLAEPSNFHLCCVRSLQMWPQVHGTLENGNGCGSSITPFSFENTGVRCIEKTKPRICKSMDLRLGVPVDYVHMRSSSTEHGQASGKAYK